MNAPVDESSVAIINSSGNALESLQKYLAALVSPLREELDVQMNRQKDILTQVVQKYKNPVFDIKKPLNMRFVDGGGVTREFFRVLMTAQSKHDGPLVLFEGQKWTSCSNAKL